MFWWLFMGIQIVTAFIAYWYGFTRGRFASAHRDFSWDCLGEGCIFHVCTTNPDLTLQLADVHMESAHPQGY